jgi:hypothetical protein
LRATDFREEPQALSLSASEHVARKARSYSLEGGTWIAWLKKYSARPIYWADHP